MTCYIVLLNVILTFYVFLSTEAATRSVLWKKVLQACNFIKKDTLGQVFSCEFCEIWKNTFFTEHLWTTASVSTWNIFLISRENVR